MRDKILFIFKAVMLMFLIQQTAALIGDLAVALVGKHLAVYTKLEYVFIGLIYLWIVLLNPKKWVINIILIAIFAEMMRLAVREELLDALWPISQHTLITLLNSIVLGLLGGLTAIVLRSKYQWDLESGHLRTRIIRSKPGIWAYFTAQKQLYECFWLFGITVFFLSEWGFYLAKRYWVSESHMLLIATAVYAFVRVLMWIVIYRCSVNVYRLSWKYAAQGVIYLDMAFVIKVINHSLIAAKSALIRF